MSKEINNPFTSTPNAAAKPRKADMSPEEWTRHVAQVRREACAKATAARSARAKEKEPISTINVFRGDLAKIREIADRLGVRNQDVVRLLLEEHGGRA